MNISSVQNNDNSRRNFFIKYSNSFMSMTNLNEKAPEKALKANLAAETKKDKTMGIETLTIFPKEIVDGKMIITA